MRKFFICFLLFTLVGVSVVNSTQLVTNEKNDQSIVYCANNDDNLESKYANLSDEKFYSVLSVGALSSLVFGFIGILPALFIRTDTDEERFKNSVIFKLLLAFAAGNLLADIFLHLLPEASTNKDSNELAMNGIYIIISFLLFLTIEKITNLIPGAHALGTLNLLANFFDNSAHGTTVVGAFQVSITFGLIALLATIIHEVPHEFSDFALLLRDGFSRQKAIVFQLLTAFSGSLGATLAFAYTFGASSVSNNSSCSNNFYLNDLNTNNNNYNNHHHENHHEFILPFTIGGFLYISLCGIIPEIVEEQNRKVSFLQLISLFLGVLFIYVLTQIENILPTYFF